MFIPTENIKKRYPKVILFDVESFHSADAQLYTENQTDQ